MTRTAVAAPPNDGREALARALRELLAYRLSLEKRIWLDDLSRRTMTREHAAGHPLRSDCQWCLAQLAGWA